VEISTNFKLHSLQSVGFDKADSIGNTDKYSGKWADWFVEVSSGEGLKQDLPTDKKAPSQRKASPLQAVSEKMDPSKPKAYSPSVSQKTQHWECKNGSWRQWVWNKGTWNKEKGRWNLIRAWLLKGGSQKPP
jgi:hypothetical protein